VAFKVINNEVITDSSVLQNTTIDESNVLNNVFNVTDGTTSQQINRGGTVTFTAGAGVTITQLNGTVTISSDAEGIEDLISPLLVHGNHTYIDATYDDLNDQVLLAVNITTDGVAEGTNLYYTDARADARIALQTGIYLDLSAKDTDDLSEGTTNLYYTDARVDARIPTNVSAFTNDAGYLTSYTETDPIFLASAASGIAAGDITNWNTAYGWGDHSLAGYLTSYTDTNTYLQSLGFNTSNGVLTATLTDSSTVTVDLDGRYSTTDTTYSAGTGLSLTGTTFANTAPDQTVVLTGSGATSISGTYPNFTISSTDTNTTYTAGSGLTLAGTTFSHTDTSSASDLTASARTYVTGLTFDTFGHVTGYSTGTETVVDTDTNTTYSIGSETATGGVNLRLTGSDATTDDVKFANGSNITITRTDANTITIAATDTNTDTLQSIANNTGAADRFITMVANASGAQSGLSNAGLKYNTSTQKLTLGGDLAVAGDATISGNLTVLGTTTTVDVASLSITDNLIYLNNGGTATITNAVGNGTTVTYTADNNFSTGYTVDVTGVNPSAYNVTDATITSANATSFTISSSATGTYVSGGSARAHTNTNVDLGWAGSYTSGSYAHAGLFRDASDGIFKVFDGYTPEPDDAVDIDTSHASFSLADMQAANFIGSLTGNAATASKWANASTITLGGDLTGNVSIDGSANVTLTATIAANSVALGTDTTGNYVAGLTAGTGIAVTGTAGEGWSPTVTHSNTTRTDTTSAGTLTHGGTFTAVDSIASNALGHVTAINVKTLTMPSDTNTTYSISSETVAGGANLRLTGSDSSTDDVKIASGTNVTVTRTDANTITISSTDTNTTYSAGTGLSLTGTVFANTAPDQTVVLTGSGATSVSGTYPNFTISSTDTNTVYTLPAATSTVRGGIELFSDTVQSVAATAVSATASRTYGVQVNSSGQAVVNVPWSDTNTTYTAGTGLTLSGTQFINAAPDQTVTLTGSGATSVSGTYPNFTISSTDTNTTYGAATSTVLGLIKLEDDTVQSVAATAVSATAGRTYGVQVNSAGQAVVNVPWVDTNTTYGVATTSANGLMSSTDKSKLDGIESGATGDQTAAEILTAIKTVDGAGSGLDADLLDGLSSASFLRADANTATTGYLQAEGFVNTAGGSLSIFNPQGASYATTTTTVTGAIKITLPQSWTNTMMRMTIRIYEYATNEAFEVVCGGYNYSPSATWANSPFAYIIGSPNVNRNFTVRLGHDGTYCCVYIGETTSTWSYPQVAVTHFVAGYSNYDADQWNDNWAVGFATTLGTITATITNSEIGRYLDGNVVWHGGNDGAGSGLDADTLDGVQGASFLRSDATDTASGVITFSNATASTSTTTGAVKITGGLGVGGAIYAGGDVTAYSDERLKDNIETITNAVNKVDQLRGVTYTRKEDGIASTGVIAQDVEKVLPQAVTTDEDGMKAVKYGNMVGLLIEAIKEQTETIKGMQAEIAELKARLNN